MIIDSPIISGSLAASGSLNQVGNVTITGSLTVTGNISGTATSASYALTASHATNVPQTASFADSATSASFASTASFSLNVPVTSSYANNATSASFATTASYLTGYISPFPYTGSAIISGSLVVTGSVAVSNLQGVGVRYLVTDASGSITAQTASAAIKQTQAFTSSANQTSFTIDNGYTTGLVDVYINGSKLAPGVEFTDTSGTVITLATGSNSGDLVEFVKYFPASGVTNNALRQLTTLTGSAGQTVFSASYTPGLLDIFYNGSRLSTSDYTANNGTYFTLATGSVDGDILDILVYSYQVGAFSGIGGQGIATQVAYFGTTNSITGSPNFTISGSTMTVTGSLIVSGSGTFTNIGPAVFSGSLTSTAGFTGSFSGTATSASFASTASFVANAQTASFVANAQSASYVLNAVSSSFATSAVTASYADSLTVAGTLTAQTLVVQTITSSVDFVTGSTRFGSISANTHQFTGSVSVSGSIISSSPITGSGFSTTANVNLGNFDLTSKYLISDGSAGLGGVISIRQDATYLPKGNGYSSIASSFSVFEFYGYTGASTYKNFTFRFDGLTDNTRRDYTLPDTSGTLALLSGSQTFNGATTFASNVTVGGNAIVQSGSVLSVYRTDNTRAIQLYTTTDECVLNSWEASSEPLHIRSMGSGGRIQFFTSGSEKMRITSGGAVNIGMTSNDYARLAVKSNSTNNYAGFNVYAPGNNNFIALTHDNNVGWITTEFASGGTGFTPLAFAVNGAERFRLTLDGAPKFRIGGATLRDVNNSVPEISQALNVHCLALSQKTSDFSQDGFGAFGIAVDRANTSAYVFAGWYSSTTSDKEFSFRGDGQAYADGSWNGGGADYAEYFEWFDGNINNEDRRGYSVSLVGNKIKIAEKGEKIIGIISGNPSVIGDSAWNMWSEKYLRDDFGTYVRDENGYRILNPNYNPDTEYIPREQRPEWSVVGLMGKLRIRKGQETMPTWIKMRDISDTVEEWLVK